MNMYCRHVYTCYHILAVLRYSVSSPPAPSSPPPSTSLQILHVGLTELLVLQEYIAQLKMYVTFTVWTPTHLLLSQNSFSHQCLALLGPLVIMGYLLQVGGPHEELRHRDTECT